MEKTLSKLRMNWDIFKLRLEIFGKKCILPFKIMEGCIQRYLLLRKIDTESQDNWEKYVKRREIAKQDEFELRRQQLLLLKNQLIWILFKVSLLANFYVISQDSLHKSDDEFLSKLNDHREDFYRTKTVVVEILKKFDEYSEINFDSDIKADIIAWEFEECKTIEEVDKKAQKISDYIQNLDIVQ